MIDRHKLNTKKHKTTKKRYKITKAEKLKKVKQSETHVTTKRQKNVTDTKG